jgi:hypothetical protein
LTEKKYSPIIMLKYILWGGLSIINFTGLILGRRADGPNFSKPPVFFQNTAYPFSTAQEEAHGKPPYKFE